METLDSTKDLFGEEKKELHAIIIEDSELVRATINNILDSKEGQYIITKYYPESINDLHKTLDKIESNSLAISYVDIDLTNFGIIHEGTDFIKLIQNRSPFIEIGACTYRKPTIYNLEHDYNIIAELKLRTEISPEKIVNNLITKLISNVERKRGINLVPNECLLIIEEEKEVELSIEEYKCYFKTIFAKRNTREYPAFEPLSNEKNIISNKISKLSFCFLLDNEYKISGFKIRTETNILKKYQIQNIFSSYEEYKRDKELYSSAYQQLIEYFFFYCLASELGNCYVKNDIKDKVKSLIELNYLSFFSQYLEYKYFSLDQNQISEEYDLEYEELLDLPNDLNIQGVVTLYMFKIIEYSDGKLTIEKISIGKKIKVETLGFEKISLIFKKEGEFLLEKGYCYKIINYKQHDGGEYTYIECMEESTFNIYKNNISIELLDFSDQIYLIKYMCDSIFYQYILKNFGITLPSGVYINIIIDPSTSTIEVLNKQITFQINEHSASLDFDKMRLKLEKDKEYLYIYINNASQKIQIEEFGNYINDIKLNQFQKKIISIFLIYYMTYGYNLDEITTNVNFLVQSPLSDFRKLFLELLFERITVQNHNIETTQKLLKSSTNSLELQIDNIFYGRIETDDNSETDDFSEASPSYIVNLLGVNDFNNQLHDIIDYHFICEVLNIRPYAGLTFKLLGYFDFTKRSFVHEVELIPQQALISRKRRYKYGN
ncbi:hypothetical protein QNI16_27235 [Cytophagaceae bacterium YF14B1]|uniref:Uncharacterized protein n=1 Tax=Xanthocytophaga flava TaxID=3048013 RepID=A0AAE3QXC8_9BACT|nr:hypothetical protein [Xanthocytophaga flavus]MDJ1484223.1 hypothetical protein [Xanthocytophaga flavus]